MTQIFRIAIVGLGRSDVIALRQVFQSVFQNGQYQFDWITADEKNINILLVNNFFTNSTSIQKIIQQEGMVYLIIDHQANEQSITDNTLHLPVHETDSLLQWFHQVVLGQDVPTAVPSTEKPSIVQPIAANKPTVLQDTDVKTIKDTETRLPPRAEKVLNGTGHNSSHGLVDIIQKAIAKKTERWALADQKATFAVIDAQQQVVWYAADYQHGTTLLQLPLRLSAVSQTPAGFTPADLKQWLWQLVWHAENDQSLLDKTKVFSLKHWPQPLGIPAQKTLIQACAYLKNKPANAESMAKDLGMLLKDAQRLLTALFAVGFADESSIAVHKLNHHATKTTQPAANDAPQEETSFLRGFLSRFRQKLGL